MLETNYKYPLVVEITMYRHNWTDNKILNEIKRSARLNKVGSSNSHFFVSTNDIRKILDTKFSEDIEYQLGLPQDKLVKNITSTYFLHSVVNTFSNLRFVKFNVSNDKDYTRKTAENQISFDYKILHARINLPELVSTKKELKMFQKMFKEIKFWSPNYREGMGEEFIKTYAETITKLMQYIDLKLESDNATLHIILLD
jgi:hypothetical protein